MRPGITLEILSERKASPGGIFWAIEGRLLTQVKMSTSEGYPIPTIFETRLVVGDDEYLFDLWEPLSSYVGAFADAVTAALTGQIRETSIDIPEYDVDLHFRKVDQNYFEIGTVFGGKPVDILVVECTTMQEFVQSLAPYLQS